MSGGSCASEGTNMDHDSHLVTRRTFLGASATGSAALLTGGLTALLGKTGAAKAPAVEVWLEKSIPELQSLMASGELTSHELTKGYLDRIHELNPLLHAVIETNPQAVGIAAKRDAERKSGKIRGLLHGIPILVKDNIATDDQMETTAGSLALVGSRVPSDATLGMAAVSGTTTPSTAVSDGIFAVNVVPPFPLSTTIVPPCNSTSSFTNERPIPVPGWARVVDSSTW